jgi:putative hydrolase of the HAD superfamily
MDVTTVGPGSIRDRHPTGPGRRGLPPMGTPRQSEQQREPGPGTIPSVLRAVLFDFGGVILTSPFEAFAAFEQRAGLPAGFLRGVNSSNPDDNAWARLERSQISLAEFDECFAAESAERGHEVRGSAVLGLLAGELRPEMVEAVTRLHGDARFVTGLLTNNFLGPATDGATGAPGVWGPVLDLFDTVVESSRIGVRKPDERFYRVACEELGIEPHEAVFLDDLGVNLKPARSMGMATIKVDDPFVAIRELEALLDLTLLA